MTKTMKLKIGGMHCKSCSMLIQDALEDVEVKAEIDAGSGDATITFDEGKISADQIKEIIRKEGYTTE